MKLHPLRHLVRTSSIGISLLALTSIIIAVSGLDGTDPVALSTTPTAGIDGDNAIKGKINYLTYETSTGSGVYEKPLVVVYADSADTGNTVWDSSGTTYEARDIFVTRSADGGVSWSTPVNISNQAGLTSVNADDDGDPDTAKVPFYGDCLKPQVVATTSTGKNVSILWASAYTNSGTQGTVFYPEAANIEVAFYSLYHSRSVDGGATWSAPERLTSGLRDVRQYTSRATGAGFVFAWQDDPSGLQPGDAEGPGEGGSGAKVSHGTDIWYTAQNKADFSASVALPTAVRVTNNYLKDKSVDQGGGGGGTATFESGQVGASRPQIALVGSTAVLTYEETKGLEKLDTGKYIRYHSFAPYTDLTPSGLTNDEAVPYALASDATDGVGYIISKPDENARRVRIIVQGTPGTNTGLLMCFLYKQGLYDQGGPSDIVARFTHKDPSDAASTGFRVEDFTPSVATTSTIRGDEDLGTGAFGNETALNLSTDTTLADSLQVSTDANNLEDARAHRGIMGGDFIAIGYTRTSDGVLARWTTEDNYDFYVRRSFDGGATWDEPRNLSNFGNSLISVREPRMVKPPSSSDPDDTTDGNVFIVAWGSEQNQYEHLSEGTIDLDLYITRTTDKGETYEPVRLLAAGDFGDAESQLRPTPDGQTVYAVWNEDSEVDGKNVLYRIYTVGDVAEQLTIDSHANPFLATRESQSSVFDVTTEGGTEDDFVFSLDSRAPSWASINASTGRITTAAPASSAGVYDFSVTVTDGDMTASDAITLIVLPADASGSSSSCSLSATNGSSTVPLVALACLIVLSLIMRRIWFSRKAN